MLKQLINELCPNGCEYKTIEEVCKIIVGSDKPKDFKIKKDGKYKYPIISNGLDEKAIQGYCQEFIIDVESVSISSRGTIGFPTLRQEPYFPVVRLICLIPNTDIISAKFLKFSLDECNFNFAAGNIKQLTKPMISSIPIPIPPLEVQNEIVKILDKFTELNKELNKELNNRIDQYKYYRNHLLTSNKWLGDEVEYKTIGEVLFINKKSKYGAKIAEKELRIGDIPFFMSGTRINYFDTWLVDGENIFMNDGGTAGIKYYFGKANYSDHIISMKSNNNEKVLTKFIYYWLCEKTDFIQVNFFKGVGLKNISKKDFLNNFSIPIPPLDKQKRIVEILDKFSTLVNDLNNGIPKELELRNKQYEYYRNKLLTFKRKG